MDETFVVLAYGRTFPTSTATHTPLSLFSLGTSLEGHGLEVAYFDERLDSWATFEALLARQPFVIGFSVMGGYQVASSQRLARRARQLSPRSHLLWGGVFPSRLPAGILGECEADSVAIGEAEETLLEVVDALRGPRSGLEGIAGLAWRDGDRIVEGPKRRAPGLDRIPFPYEGTARSLLGRYVGRSEKREAVGFEGSRGCPFRCGFCYSPEFRDSVRIKSPDRLRRELESLRQAGVSTLDIYDDVLMGGSVDAIESLTDAIGDLGFEWMANLRIELVSRRLLQRLDAAGCRWLYFGLESNDDETLRSIGKGFSPAQIRTGLELLAESPIHSVFSIIAGLPTDESSEGVTRALEWAATIHGTHPDAEIQIQSYVPLPETRLFSRAVDRGFQAPTTVAGWAALDHLSVSLPWLDDPSLPSKLYLSSFLSYRYQRHFGGRLVRWLVFPLHRLSAWRLKNRAFGCYGEGVLLSTAMRLASSWTAFRVTLRKVASSLGPRRPGR